MKSYFGNIFANIKSQFQVSRSQKIALVITERVLKLYAIKQVLSKPFFVYCV